MPRLKPAVRRRAKFFRVMLRDDERAFADHVVSSTGKPARVVVMAALAMYAVARGIPTEGAAP